MKVFTVVKPIVEISGQATGVDLSLSQNSLQFGAVRKFGCKTWRIMLFNKGDVGTKFYWQPFRDQTFNLTPMEGYIAARTTVTVAISFKPKEINPFVKTWAHCNFENHHPLEISLYGSCIDLDAMEVKTLKFKCPVRDSENIFVTISNHSDDLWDVYPETHGVAFETLKNFQVEPHSSVDIPISFKPKKMGQQEGSVLLSPLGENALYFILDGTADPPHPNAICEIEAVCKEPFTQVFLVHNLTEHPETYVAQTEVLKTTPDAFRGFYEITCPRKVTVWGEAAAPCHWKIVVYEQVVMNLKISFVNEETKEFQYYFVVVTVTPSPLAGVIEMTAKARESVQKKLTIKNPLSEDLPFILTCADEFVKYDNQVMVARKSETQCTLTYSPLVTGSTEVFLEAGHPMVGVFVYKLLLTCLEATAKTQVVSTELGTRVPVRLRVHNKYDRATEFVCTTTNSSYHCEKSYYLGPNERGKFLIWFEPNNIGPQTGEILFSSPTGGNFMFNMEGTATQPTPLGPVEIKAGTSETITFKNIFEDTRTFKIFVDRQEFAIKNSYETAQPRQEIKIAVMLKKPSTAKPRGMGPTGCLTIECYEPADPKVVWTYFLLGLN